MRSLDTTICLPPGILSGAVVRELFRLVFEKYRWFEPVRYGFAGLRERVEPGSKVHEALLDYYGKRKVITVAAKTDRDFLLIFPARSDAPPYTGAMTWVTSATAAKKSAWRTAHLSQVVEVMRLVGAPLAYTAMDEDIGRKTQRLVPAPDGVGQIQAFTVRDPSEGLAGLFWRSFFGPPFVRMFGERLSSLPAEVRREVGDGIVLVQPYESPTQAGTPEGDARERELIAQLGRECFYDHERHLKPSRLPELALPAAR